MDELGAEFPQWYPVQGHLIRADVDVLQQQGG